MAAVSIDRMSLKELRALRDRIDSEIQEREHQERADLKAKLSDMVTKAGFDVSELFGSAGRRSKAVVKYCHPNDPSQTWTGRGRRPKWLASIKGDIEKFRVY